MATRSSPTSLFHYSEDPTIEVFHPHVAATQQVEGAWVWAVDAARADTYWFPRQCPRGSFWALDAAAPTAQAELLLAGARRVHAIEWRWLPAMSSTVLYEYRFEPTGFRYTTELFGGAGRGFWATAETVRPTSVQPVGDLLQRHRDAGNELRLVGDLRAYWNVVIATPGIDFSGIRLGNAAGPEMPG